QPRIAGPPHHARFQQRAAKGLEVLADQLFALLLRQPRQAQLDVDRSNAAVAARHEISQPAQRAADRELRAQWQNVHGTNQPKPQPDRPVAWSQEAVERNARARST